MSDGSGFADLVVLWLLAALVLWIPAIFVTASMGKQRGQEYSWLWGFLLGWLGVLGVLLIGDRRQPYMPQHPTGMSFPSAPVDAMKTCPRCAESVKAAAKVCRYCGYEFEAPNSPA